MKYEDIYQEPVSGHLNGFPHIPEDPVTINFVADENGKPQIALSDRGYSDDFWLFFDFRRFMLLAPEVIEDLYVGQAHMDREGLVALRELCSIAEDVQKKASQMLAKYEEQNETET